MVSGSAGAGSRWPSKGSSVSGRIAERGTAARTVAVS